MVKDRLERKWSLDKEKFPAYYIDVLTARPASNLMSEKFGVKHESPQIFVIKEGKCVYTASHSEINYDDLLAVLNN
jgi:bacillithiol system protein YtxJ